MEYLLAFGIIGFFILINIIMNFLVVPYMLMITIAALGLASFSFLQCLALWLVARAVVKLLRSLIKAVVGSN